ncbi:putative restriction endonuclease R.XmaI [Pseudomonas syringae pv. cilantro]|uniref:Putative restriction endonuclease R.XmaI n=2 Tax=Pseudomonas syringae group TaxID=136849 RepID=A0A0P9L9U5_9PSED|nr:MULTISPECIES: XcyI family restriction endonuclease [Pseudomonas syringae group]KPC34868.1 putative restriction endonuclease R.XmaI [Pseudomonas syringae pv. cilantro]KPW73768.1 putative restriction endonuclease R.XmaI [Pseudomonas syringae pv. coriandricola]RMN10618.1 putative restriction endonuclease R.XmaI [Pseudomonas syringae pv. coriandricola]RMO97269.1 putative restriction endonuclease R.XmaI [Pseudomonas amygdali pv. morsprunorum]RMU05508.1 putative restriction endonuclease R.XmaI [P
MKKDLAFPLPELQVSFSLKLQEFRNVWLQDALLETVSELAVPTIDAELSKYVPAKDLKALAARGLRGELVFAVPAILHANPHLLGYYRLLLGYSQKEFYGSEFGVASMKCMEVNGRLNPRSVVKVEELCVALCKAASHLVGNLKAKDLSIGLLDDLTLLTVGPQMRGGVNNKLGQQGIVDVFDVIEEILRPAIINATRGAIEIKNMSGRDVWVEFAADPDIVIREVMPDKSSRRILAIEVKSGTDVSNIHNRIGEAEKSHQKAKKDGYRECWTVVNVSKLDIDKAKLESPTTNVFYALKALQLRKGAVYEDFKQNIIAMVGISS